MKRDLPPRGDAFTPLAGLQAATTLRDIVILTFQVSAGLVRAALPVNAPRLVTVSIAGRECALVSVLCFQQCRLRVPAWMPLGITHHQTNYRTYVEDEQGCPAVSFFGMSSDTRIGRALSGFLGLPVLPATYSAAHAGSWDEGSRRLRYDIAGSRVAGRIDASDCGPAPSALPGFDRAEEGIRLLTEPGVGYAQGTRGLMRVDVWHEPLRIRSGALNDIRLDGLRQLHLQESDTPPDLHSVLLCPAAEFRFSLPYRV